MKKEEITELAEILTKMKEDVSRLEQAKNRSNLVEFKKIKEDILELGKQVDKRL